jgi:hypothetical protein
MATLKSLILKLQQGKKAQKNHGGVTGTINRRLPLEGLETAQAVTTAVTLVWVGKSKPRQNGAWKVSDLPLD